MNFIKGEAIRSHPQLKQSFLWLAKEIFGLEFEQWDALGYWDNTYCPYAFEVEGEIVKVAVGLPSILNLQQGIGVHQ